MTQGVSHIQSTMQAAEAMLSQAAAPPAETWSSAQLFKFKTREDAGHPHGANGKSKPIWQVMQELSREMRQGNGRNGRGRAQQDLSRQDEPLAERWKLQSEGLSSQVASLRAQLAESRRNQECLQNDLYESMRREASLKAKLAATNSKLDAVERWAQVLGQHMEEEVSRNFLESDKRQLQNLTECLALAVKSMALFVGLMDKDTAGQLRYTFVHNQKQFFGDADMVGKRDDEILPASIPGVREGMAIKQRALESRSTASGEITLVLPDACTHWMLTCEPRLGERSEVVGVAVAAVNITETVEGRARLAKLHSEIAARDATEAELRKAIRLTEEAVKTKSMFLAIMSHEMRTPLNGVLGMAHVLNTTPLDEEQRELVDAMLASGDTLLAMVDDAVDVRKLESGEVSQHCHPFNPHQIVNQVLHMAAAAVRSKAITFEANISSDVPTTILGDELRIRQVLTNLVHNSLKFTDSGFIRIAISVSETPPSPTQPAQSDSRCHQSSSDADCVSSVTIAGGESASRDEATSRGFGRRLLSTHGFQIPEVASEEEQQSAFTPSSVLDARLRNMDECALERRPCSRADNSETPCPGCGVASGSEGVCCSDQGAGGLHRSLTRHRSLDKQTGSDAVRVGRGMERLQRQSSWSSSGGRQMSPQTARPDPVRRPGGPASERVIQSENSLASISEGMLDFDQAVGRIEAGVDGIRCARTLSRESSLDSAPGTPGGGSLRPSHHPQRESAVGRLGPLQRQPSFSYATEGFSVEVSDGPNRRALGRSTSAWPEKIEGFGRLDERRTASEHAFRRYGSFDEAPEAPRVWLQVSVADSGCGIPEEAFPMLFEKFTQVDASTTRQYGGTGLGLAICKQLVENILCGKMEVESTLDQGSTFTFTVPCQKLVTDPVPSLQQEACSSPGRTCEQPGISGSDATGESAPAGSLEPRHREEPAPAVEAGQPFSFQGAGPSRKPPPLDVPCFDHEVQDRASLPGAPSPSPDWLTPPSDRPLTLPTNWSPTAPPASTVSHLGSPEKVKVSHGDFPKRETVRQPAAKKDALAPPLSPNPPTSPFPAPPPPDSPPSLLLVEDNNINVVVAQSMLKRLGLRADIAGNGVEAVRALAHKTYHMVMMDICMPRMDGLQATSAVRRFEETGVWRFDVLDSDLKELETRPSRPDSGCQQGVHVPIVAMTANAMEMDVNRCYSHGLDAFIAKPVSFATLRSVLKHFLPWYTFELKGARK